MLKYRLISALVALGALSAAGASTALADPSGDVRIGQGPLEKTVTVTVNVPGAQGGGPITAASPASAPADQEAGGGTKCTDKYSGGVEVPCTSDLGGWNNEHACYVSPVDPPPPPDDPRWQGHTDGALYSCFRAPLPTIFFWSPDPPQGAAGAPDPGKLAQQAVAEMGLRGITIGMVPEDKPGYRGSVGLPVWMWVENPTANTWGPISKSVSAGGYTVTARAYVADVRWEMGDGQTVTCTTSGTRYDDSYGNSSSPSCGYRYSRKGDYTVTAIADWVVDWEGIGQRGTLNTTTTSSRPVKIGEIQVVNR